MGILWRRQVDAVGVFVLSGIILAALLGLATGSGRLYLLDGAILTGTSLQLGVLGAACGSRAMMFHSARASTGGV